MRSYMYVAITGEDRVAIFEIDAETGRLEPRGDVAVPGRPYPLAVDPERRYLYVGRLDAREISSFRIDPSTGRPALIGTAALESDPCFLATDRTGRHMLSAYYGAGRVAVHPIGEDGVVGGPPVEWLETAPGAHSVQTDRSNTFAFVPSIAGESGGNAIFQFKFDGRIGHLTPNSPARVTPPEEIGPRHFCFHPNRDVVYFSNEQGCSVTAYNLDRASGTLNALQTVSTMPDGYVGENTCSQIQISPSGRFLYAPNRGHDSIACFSLDEADGRLTPLQRVPTEPMPRALSLGPQGKFLYVAGEASGRLASYRVDDARGTLEPMGMEDVGEEPMWVLIAGLEA